MRLPVWFALTKSDVDLSTSRREAKKLVVVLILVLAEGVSCLVVHVLTTVLLMANVFLTTR